MARLRVRVTPRASRAAIAGWRDGVLHVRVTAPPSEGKANDAVTRLLAEALGVPRSAVVVRSGHGARDKHIEVVGLEDDEVRRRLEAGA